MADKKKGTVREDVATLRGMSEEQLAEKLEETRKELLDARFKHATAQLEKTSELKALRKQVARISTVMNEKRS